MQYLYNLCLVILLSLQDSACVPPPDVLLGQKCEVITLKSGDNLPAASQVIKDAEGAPAKILLVTVLKQISAVECVQDETFFIVAYSTLLVKKGCQAQFRVCYKVKAGVTPKPYEGTAACMELELLSKETAPDEKLVPLFAEGGNLIVNMTLLKQYSKVACIPGLTYEFYSIKVMARLGCQGRFKVCVDPKLSVFTQKPEVTCELIALKSQPNTPAQVTVTFRGGIVTMTLVKEYSRKACDFGSTFGFNKLYGSEVYARGDCWGEFDVCQSPKDI